MEKRWIKIAGHRIGPGEPCFIVAEAGVNHNGSLEIAKKMVDVAVQSGANAVKFQAYRTTSLVLPSAQKAEYQRMNGDASETQHEMLRQLELSESDLEALQSYCKAKDILFMASVFDWESADFLKQLNVDVIKIPSGEITNLPLLANVAEFGIPLIVSTGMASLGDIETALKTIRQAGNSQYALLHCVSNYPTNPAEVNLRAMQTLASAFLAPVGFSDHTIGIEVTIAAVALGAAIIEKHFTLDRQMTGPDHRASLEPDELKAMVQAIRTVESALGDGRKEPTADEMQTARAARKSLVTASFIPAGTVLTLAHLTAKRPGTGLPPSFLPFILGRRLKADTPAEELLTLDMLA
jgi:N-acetylneuraminate synthase